LEAKVFYCVECGGKGCGACKESGRFETKDCPQKVARPMSKTLALIDMADKGHLPVTGGVMDQSAWFIEAYRYYTSEFERSKAKACG
jgi:hypothetical protein